MMPIGTDTMACATSVGHRDIHLAVGVILGLYLLIIVPSIGASVPVVTLECSECHILAIHAYIMIHEGWL